MKTLTDKQSFAALIFILFLFAIAGTIEADHMEFDKQESTQ